MYSLASSGYEESFYGKAAPMRETSFMQSLSERELAAESDFNGDSRSRSGRRSYSESVAASEDEGPNAGDRELVNDEQENQQREATALENKNQQMKIARQQVDIGIFYSAPDGDSLPDHNGKSSGATAFDSSNTGTSTSKDALFDLYCRLNYLRMHEKKFKNTEKSFKRNCEIQGLERDVQALKKLLDRNTASFQETVSTVQSTHTHDDSDAQMPPSRASCAAQLELKRRKLARLRAQRSIALRDDMNLLLKSIDDQLSVLNPRESLGLMCERLDRFSWKTPMWIGYRPLLLLKHKTGAYTKWLQSGCPEPPHVALLQSKSANGEAFDSVMGVEAAESELRDEPAYQKQYDAEEFPDFDAFHSGPSRGNEGVLVEESLKLDFAFEGKRLAHVDMPQESSELTEKSGSPHTMASHVELSKEDARTLEAKKAAALERRKAVDITSLDLKVLEEKKKAALARREQIRQRQHHLMD